MTQHTDLSQYFSLNYTEARQKFIASAEKHDATLHSIKHPLQGPDSEDLYMDFAVIGPDDAEDAMLLISGTHGIEGFCGSFLQNTLLNDPVQMKALSGMKLVLLHAHNPHGFAWLRRTTETNVDMNRNYCDYSTELDMNEAYTEVKDLIIPKVYNDDAEAAMQEWIQENGVKRYQEVVMSGQRVDPEGIFFGDTKPAWSNEQVSAMLPKILEKQKRVFAIDIHTGLGPYGHGDAVHAYPKESEQYINMRQWFNGEVVGILAGEYGDVAAALPKGPIVASFDHLLPNHNMYAFVIEYGTVEFDRVIKALRMDGWLHAKGDVNSAQGKAIKQEMRDCFYANDPAWFDAIWTRMEWCLEGFYKNR